MNRQALGRGLGALIPGAGDEGGQTEIREIAVGLIEPSKDQPRTRFNEESLRELAESVKRHGIVQPLVVRHMATGGFGLVVGERRLRAAKLAGLETVPAIVREVDERAGLEIALVENLQREDLNPIDEARGYEALMEISGETQVHVAERVGKDRSTIANALRLLELPADVQEMLTVGALSAGHGRALLGLRSAAEQAAIAQRTIAEGLSVRQVEALTRGKVKRRKASRPARRADPAVRDWEERLQRVLGTLVRIDRLGTEGTIRIEYYSEEDLERILDFFFSRAPRV
jgi:ParB family chromosome partitioning protein